VEPVAIGSILPRVTALSAEKDGSVKNRVKITGFTLIELLVVMAVIAILLTIAVPRYFGSVDHSKEVALKQSLNVMRDAIDKFHGDTGAYPETLDDLVAKKYLRAIPVDPITDSATTWQVISPPDGKFSGVYNIKSGGSGAARDGSSYQDW
jgi:general secretion pathway protein G